MKLNRFSQNQTKYLPCAEMPRGFSEATTCSISFFLRNPLSIRMAVTLLGPSAFDISAVLTVLSTPPLTSDYHIRSVLKFSRGEGVAY